MYEETSNPTESSIPESSSAIEPKSELKGRIVEKRALTTPNILDPDDELMKRFQNALHAHLCRVNDKLSGEILDLEAEVKCAEKKFEAESLQLYYDQQEAVRQQTTIEKYQNMLSELTTLKEGKEKSIANTKQAHQDASVKFAEEKRKEEILAHELEKLTSLYSHFTEWERDLNNCLITSKRITKKDMAVQRELIYQKQQRDCILFKLVEELWKLESEIANLDGQLQLKDKEKRNMSQMVADANADLEALHKEHVNICKAWNSVVMNISKRDKIYDQLNMERGKTYEDFNAIQSAIDKAKKETNKEMENNEYLTSLHSRVEDTIQIVSKTLAGDNEKISNFTSQLAKLGKYVEQAERNYNNVCNEYQHYVYKGEQIDKDIEGFVTAQNELENTIYAKLEDKVTHDKAARYLNKLLLNFKETSLEREFLVIRTENSYGKNLLQIERITSAISNLKGELQDLLDKNFMKEKQIDNVQKQIKNCDTTIERQQKKILSVNKIIEEASLNLGTEDLSPQDLKITGLENSILELEQNNQTAQQFWIRQQGFMLTLSQQRDSQLQELNLLNKEITIMEQKNLKLKYALENLDKEEAAMNRLINSLQQRLVQMNSNLVAQKDFKDELQGKNCIKRNECAMSLQNAELNLIKLQNELRELGNDKITLKEELNIVQQESLSWEKKVQLMSETAKRLKDERSSGGDIALMKNEIHKMEMRLLHLRGVQEKLIHDMEFCVTRRDIIFDNMLGKMKRNSKMQHKQSAILCKRLADQKLKIKQLKRDVRDTESEIAEFETKVKKIQETIDNCQASLKLTQESIPTIEKKIMTMEAVKSHNLQALVFKQRKVKLLQDIQNGKYKMLLKSEFTIDEELQNERLLSSYLKYVMERTNQDFPMLKAGIQKILFTLQIL